MANFNSEEKQFFKADNEPFNATVEYLTSSFASTEGHASWLCLKERQIWFSSKQARIFLEIYLDLDEYIPIKEKQQNMWSIEITKFSHFLTFVNPASILRYYASLIPEIYEKKKKRKHAQRKTKQTKQKMF